MSKVSQVWRDPRRPHELRLDLLASQVSACLRECRRAGSREPLALFLNRLVDAMHSGPDLRGTSDARPNGRKKSSREAVERPERGRPVP
jgi:hypothetical protein